MTSDKLNRLKELTNSIIKAEAEINRVNKQKDILLEILTILNFLDSEVDSIAAILRIIKKYTDVDAAALRIEDSEDYPYYAVYGFPDEFVKLEDSVCSKDSEGRVILRDAGGFELDCLCGCVLRDCAEEQYEFFTSNGSFYTGNSSHLIETGNVPSGIKLRGTCIKFGYETIALIPLRSKERIIGLLQLNDKRTNAVSEETVRFFEEAGKSIGVALERIRLMEKLKEKCNGRSGEYYEL